jgi:protein TonB
VAAQNAGIKGVVVIAAMITPSGRVQEVRTTSPRTVFDKAALDAVRQWEYEPTVVHGVAVAVPITVTVEFNLK